MTDIFEKCYSFTEAKELMQEGLYPYFKEISSVQENEVIIDGKRVIMLGSNNYLGLASDARVKEAAIEAVQKYGGGCSGSRLLNGTLNLHIELEAKVAAFVKKEGVLTYSAGFQTNLGIISALAGRNDYIIADRQNHASLVDACRLSFARLLKYRHNDMEDLEKVLSNVPDNKGKLIVVDGVFSMEGDIANLPEIVRLAKEYGARIMVDDSHGLGVMGEHGRGTAEYFYLEAEVDIVMATFSKSLGSIGGFVAAKEPVIHYIKHHSRPFIFSASISPANAAAAIKALSILEQEPERVRNLWENARFLRSTLEDMGVRIGSTQTPITPILIGNDYQTFALTKALLDEGVYVNPVVSPAVEEGHSLIRAVCTSTHTKEQLEYALRAFEKVFRTIRSHNLITAN